MRQFKNITTCRLICLLLVTLIHPWFFLAIFHRLKSTYFLHMARLFDMRSVIHSQGSYSPKPTGRLVFNCWYWLKEKGNLGLRVHHVRRIIYWKFKLFMVLAIVPPTCFGTPTKSNGPRAVCPGCTRLVPRQAAPSLCPSRSFLCSGVKITAFVIFTDSC